MCVMMTNRFVSWTLGIFVGLFLLTVAKTSESASIVFYDETQFLTYAGSVTMESFETITFDNWTLGTSLSSPIPAYDEDNPDYDLDTHFTITGNSLYGGDDAKFVIWNNDSNSSLDTLWGEQYLKFSPLSGGSTKVVTFDNFNNTNDSINAFGLYIYYNPGENNDNWVALRFGGDEYRVSEVTGGAGWYFFGGICDSPFTQVELFTSQNGGNIYLDGIYYSSDANPVPIPSAIWLFGSGIISLIGLRRKFRKEP